MDKDWTAWTSGPDRRALVTGATGMVGRALVRALGDHVITTSRDAARARARGATKVVGWDARSPIGADALDGVEAVFHLAGEPVAGRWTKAKKARIRASRVESTHALVSSILARPPSARPKVLVCASAIGIYGSRGDAWLDEESPAGDGFLTEICRAWEAEAARAREGGVRVVSVRIGLVLSREGGALAAMLPAFRMGLGAKLGDGRQWSSFIHLDDLVALLRFSASNDALDGPVNGVAGAVTNAEYTHALGRALRRPAFLRVPAAVLRLGAGEMSEIMLASQRVDPKRAREAGFRFRFPTIDEVFDDLFARSRRHILQREQVIPRPRAEVYRFFADPTNLERITSEFLHFRITTPKPIPMREGTLIDYRLSLFGVPFSWRTRIEKVEEDERFVDTQLRGPYRTWRHLHELEDAGPNATKMTDVVEYELPFGVLGNAARAMFVERTLDRIFDYRADAITSLFPAS